MAAALGRGNIVPAPTKKDINGRACGKRMGGWSYLHEVLLRPFVVHAGARYITRDLAEHVVWLASGHVRNAHVL